MARLATLLLLSAVGASAQPHGHGHAQFHKKGRNAEVEERDIGDVIVATIGGDVVSWTQTENYYEPSVTLVVAAANTATTPTSAPASTTTSASSSSTTLATSTTAASSSSSTTASSTSAAATSSSSASSSGVTSYTSFTDYCSTYSSSSKKRATLAEITQTGNVGSPYGCNMMPVASEEVAAQYNNTAAFSGASEDMICAYWNKIGSDGLLDGWYKSTNSYRTFDLAAGATQYLAFDDGSQGGASCFPASTGLEVDGNGGFVGTWIEWTFVDVSTGWSAADASAIQAQAAGTTVNAVEVCNAADSSATCSTITAGAVKVVEAFVYATKDDDGYGLNVDGPLKIAVTLS